MKNNKHLIAHIGVQRYLTSLWVLPVLLFLMQAIIWLTGNPTAASIPVWVLFISPIIFIGLFAFATFWAHQPIHFAIYGKADITVEKAMASLPLRAIKAFGIAGLIFVIYLLAFISIASSLSEHPLTPRMVVALDLSVLFSLGILIPTLAVSLTMAWMAKVRKKLSLQNLFIGNLEHFHNYPWIIRASNRPWLIFGVTSLIPVSILGIFTWLLLGTTNELEQRFILMQSIVLFFNLIVGGAALVWVTSKTVHRITRELALGLNFLKQGKFDGHVAVMVDDDMGNLARGLNTALAGLKERETLKDSLAIASDIQRGLMPKSEPDVKGYSIAGFQKSSFSVGGDYYDYIIRNNGNVWLVIADVAGKGYPAALTVANLQAMLHALANGHSISLLDAADYINKSLYNSLQGGRFVTLFMAELNPTEHHLEWLNAGHIPPLLWDNNAISRLEATSPPLGMLPEISLKSESLSLEAGTMLFACTDGITEARNNALDMFSDQGVEAWFTEKNQLEPSELPSSIMAHLNETGYTTQDDDITMLCLKRSKHEQ